MKNIKPTMLIAILLTVLFTNTGIQVVSSAEYKHDEPTRSVSAPKYTLPVAEELAVVSVEAPAVTPQPEPEPLMSIEDIELIALVTMGEAEGECEEGQRLVIDTILNRVDSPHFPDTVQEVIWQPNQFSAMWNGRLDRCYVREDICQLVREELENRLNYDVIFFNAGHYSKYGTPLFQVEHHYFSSY